jgi:hypothetical protein
MLRSTFIGLAVLGAVGTATAVTIPGGGSKRNDCAVTLQSDGLAFPADKALPKGVTCADGGPCDADGVVDGACDLVVAFCTNVQSEALPKCGPSEVTSLTVTKGKLKGGGALDLSDLEAAANSLALPTSEMICGQPATVRVPVRGPDSKGELSSGTAKIKTKAATSRGKDKDNFSLVCRPSTGVPTVTSTTSTTSTSEPGVTTTTSTSTSTTLAGGVPGDGLVFSIEDVQVNAAGVIDVTFLLTDANGVPLVPTGSSTTDPTKGRVRFDVARLEVDEETVEGFTTTFTKWQNYLLNANGMPTFDSGGSFTAAGPPAGTWVYTFNNALPAGYPAQLTHRIGGQVDRRVGDLRLSENSTWDFVPAGGPVTTER